MYLCIFNRKKMNRISAIIITHNEERNIGRCIESLKGVADEIIVVDSGSTDATEAICLGLGAKFVPHPWAGYSGQKNYANGLASNPWTLSIDADEALSPTLQQTLRTLKQEGLSDDTAYSMNRLTNFCGSWIHHCGWYPDTKVRLWPSGKAQWEGDIHEELRLEGVPCRDHLKGDLLHYSYYEIDDLARRQPRYYQLAAQSAFDAGRRAGMAAIVLKPCWTFVRDYLLRGGFRDGRAGYILCRMNAHYTFMKYTTLFQKCSAAKQGKHQKNGPNR